jgi:ubiquinone/menaquinone biosynthesis C-methylase UbiE
MRQTDYDAIADGYDVRYRTYDYHEIKAGLDAFLGEPAPGRLLEVGCGTGYWLRTLAGRARLVAGVDRSKEMLARAAASGASAIVRGDATRLPFGDGAFDRIICINALHHFPRRDWFFAEARRLLGTSGGVFNVGLDPHADRDHWWVYEYFPETRRIDLDRYPAVRTIRGDLAKAGFSWAESYEIQVFEHAMPARQAFARGLVARSFTSQLAVLTDEEFEAGVSRLREAMAAAERGDGELMLSSELHFYATTGWIAS